MHLIDRRVRRLWILVGLATGCTGAPHVPDSPNERLGIARFEIRETADSATVIGRDAEGQDVGRLDLHRGRFALSRTFAEGYDDPLVDGRKLAVRVRQQSLDWETEGYAATRALPAHPPSQWAIAAFLEDPHVKPILENWGIGFQAADAPSPYQCDLDGTNSCRCTPLTCPTIFGATPSACAGNGADVAFIVHQRAGAGYHSDLSNPNEIIHDQSFIAQCCPYISDAMPAIFAKKSCTDSTTCSATAPCQTTCGPVTIGSRCKACPTYASNGKCDIFVEDAGWSDPDAPVIASNYCGEAGVRSVEAQQAVSNVCVRYAWSCGDGVCDKDETCASCPADCGCNGFDTCGGGGTPEMCGCTPLTACPAGFQCATIDDGCGGTLDCSGGRTCDEIVGKKNYECVVASHRCCKHGRCEDDVDAD